MAKENSGISICIHFKGLSGRASDPERTAATATTSSTMVLVVLLIKLEAIIAMSLEAAVTSC